MKNKKNIYILMPLVLLVWGAVLFQIFSFTSTEEELPQNSAEFSFRPLKIHERKPFVINVNYRDPFLGKIYSAQNAPIKKTLYPESKKTVKSTEDLVWPAINYKGMIADSKGKNKLFVIIINNKNHYMKIGDTEDEIFLKDGDKESIYVKYKGNLNLIMLQD